MSDRPWELPLYIDERVKHHVFDATRGIVASFINELQAAAFVALVKETSTLRSELETSEASALAWRLIANKNGELADLPKGERETAYKKALDETTAELENQIAENATRGRVKDMLDDKCVCGHRRALHVDENGYDVRCEECDCMDFELRRAPPRPTP